MNSKPQMASGGTGHEDAADRSVTCAPADSFVINLCSSTTPMALTQPDAPELKRFRFFVSRRLEDRRERFRLHMGYFASLEEAEEWLSVVRDVYPGAWAGEAPGKRLRARAAAALPASPSLPFEAAAAAVAAPAASPWEAPSASIIALSSDIAVAIPVLPPAPAALTSAPSETAAVSTAAPAATASPPATPASAIATPEVVAAIMLPAESPAASIIAAPENGAAPAAAPITPPSARPQEQPKDAVIAVTAPSAAAPRVPSVKKSKEAAASVAASSTRAAPMAPLSNVREVLASLDERDAKDAAPAPSAAERTPTLSDTQVMKILEERRSRERARAETPDASSNVPMLRPDDTGTARALKEAVQDNAAVSFAVQLQWSVQPMALDKVPPLAIFSAYTLYTVEGNREGRKWYGLRLGFFSDAEAAKQVAHYVRSEFTAVAVVPVSPQERGRATEADQKTQIASFRETSCKTQAEEIKLLDEENADLLPRAPAEPMRGAAKLAAGGAHTVSPAARAAARSKKLRSKARTAERKAPHSLEETLEILGAGALEIDNGRGEFINESRVRHLKVEVRKNSPFARLVARLTERVRKS
jgi:hypothetical protein